MDTRDAANRSGGRGEARGTRERRTWPVTSHPFNSSTFHSLFLADRQKETRARALNSSSVSRSPLVLLHRGTEAWFRHVKVTRNRFLHGPVNRGATWKQTRPRKKDSFGHMVHMVKKLAATF